MAVADAVALGLTLGLLVAGSVFVWNCERVFLNVAKAHGSLPLSLRAWTTPILDSTASLQQEGNTMNSTEMAVRSEFRCGVKTLGRAGYSCVRLAGHEGFHETTGGYQWRRSLDAPVRCGYLSTFADPCQLPADHIGDHKDVYGSRFRDHCPKCATSPRERPRERWHFAGREVTADGVPFYVWQLRNPDGTVNSSWVAPVADLTTAADLLRPWVSEREGE
jgi:hypothetical protein